MSLISINQKLVRNTKVNLRSPNKIRYLNISPKVRRRHIPILKIVISCTQGSSLAIPSLLCLVSFFRCEWIASSRVLGYNRFWGQKWFLNNNTTDQIKQKSKLMYFTCFPFCFSNCQITIVIILDSLTLISFYH